MDLPSIMSKSWTVRWKCSERTRTRRKIGFRARDQRPYAAGADGRGRQRRSASSHPTSKKPSKATEFGRHWYFLLPSSRPHRTYVLQSIKRLFGLSSSNMHASSSTLIRRNYSPITGQYPGDYDRHRRKGMADALTTTGECLNAQQPFEMLFTHFYSNMLRRTGTNDQAKHLFRNVQLYL